MRKPLEFGNVPFFEGGGPHPTLGPRTARACNEFFFPRAYAEENLKFGLFCCGAQLKKGSCAPFFGWFGHQCLCIGEPGRPCAARACNKYFAKMRKPLKFDKVPCCEGGEPHPTLGPRVARTCNEYSYSRCAEKFEVWFILPHGVWGRSFAAPLLFCQVDLDFSFCKNAKAFGIWQSAALKAASRTQRLGRAQQEFSTNLFVRVARTNLKFGLFCCGIQFKGGLRPFFCQFGFLLLQKCKSL